MCVSPHGRQKARAHTHTHFRAHMAGQAYTGKINYDLKNNIRGSTCIILIPK